MVEGARLESVCTGNCTESSNLSLSAIIFESVPFPGRTAALWSCAMESREPRQVRKEAAVSESLHVPRGRLGAAARR